MCTYPFLCAPLHSLSPSVACWPLFLLLLLLPLLFLRILFLYFPCLVSLLLPHPFSVLCFAPILLLFLLRLFLPVLLLLLVLGSLLCLLPLSLCLTASLV